MDKDMPELLPCPFCGSHDVFIERADFTACFVMCNDCSMHGPESCTEDEEQSRLQEENDKYPGYYAAIRLWNTRTDRYEALQKLAQDMAGALSCYKTGHPKGIADQQLQAYEQFMKGEG